MRPRTAAIAVVLTVAALRPAAAQNPFAAPGGSYDPAVPTPRAVLGYEPGDRFTPHWMLTRYLERLAATSRRITVDTVATTFEGRAVFLVIATSEANMQKLDRIRADMQRLADPRGATPSELDAVVQRAVPAAWLGFTVHGGEASGAEAAIALLYQLAAGQDAETRMLLDSLVVLVDPLENPDGHERHVEDVLKMRGMLGPATSPFAMVQSGSWPGPRTSHYYFDLNRDWFILSHPESRGRVAAMQEWWPLVAADLHEMGSNSTYYFAPPMPPVNKNVPANIVQWWDIYGAANAAAFDRHGWSFFRHEGYDEFYPGYGDSWPILAGAIGMTYEEASSAGGAVRREDGTILTLHDAAWHHYTAAWATLVTTARRARDKVRDFLAFRQATVADGERAPLRAVAIERDSTGRADSLAARLLMNGVEVERLRSAADAPGAVVFGEAGSQAPPAPARGAAPARLAAGSYVVDLAQPMGRLARALLEPDAQLDSSFIQEELLHRREGIGDRFYDVTAWALPYAFRVRAWSLRGVPPGGERVTLPQVTDRPPRPMGTGLRAANYGYAFRPGSEASLRMLAGLLAAEVRVWFAPKAFTQGGERFPQGAFVVRVAANDTGVHALVRALEDSTGADVVPLASALADSGTDLGSNSVFPIKRPRVALVGGAPVSGNSFGFAWYAFEQRLGYPVTPIAAASLGGAALEDFDVVVVPSVSAGALDGVLGEGGRNRVADWVRRGGTLIALDGAMSWLASERLGLARIRLRRDTTRADSTAGAALPASVPGAVVRVVGDTISPLLAGIRDAEFPVLVDGDRIYTAPRDLRPGEAVVRFARENRLRVSGYLWPEVPARLAESVYLWTEPDGRGRVIGFAADPNWRDLWRGLLPLFANAVFIGPSM